MRFGRDHLIFKALVALDEAAKAGSAGPVQKTYALRFALAFLYAFSDGDRHPYEEFWSCLDRDDQQTLANYIRGTHLSACLVGIVRSLGLSQTPEFYELLRQGRMPKAERQACERRRRRMEAAKRTIASSSNGAETGDMDTKRQQAPSTGEPLNVEQNGSPPAQD